MTQWDNDISAAPRGKMVPYTRKGKDGPISTESFRKEYVLAVDAHGAVYQSYWIPPRCTQSGGLLEGNRWSGFNPGVDPIAWAPWPEYDPSAAKRGAFNIDPEAFRKLVDEGRAFADTDPEARFIADAENACPHCGGSGHKDDVITEPQRQQGTDGGEIAAVKGKSRLANAAGVEPSPSDHFILEDVGGGA